MMIKSFKLYIKESLEEDDLDHEEEQDEDDSFITDDKFKQFLIRNDCLAEYVSNCHNEYLTNFPKFYKFKEDFKNKKRYHFIDDAFDWETSPEGYGFWDKLNEEWYNISYKVNYLNEEYFEEFEEDFITDDEFKKFLIDHKCLDKYIENALNVELKHGMNDKEFAENFKKYRKEDYMRSAFSWGRSPEEWHYWKLMNKLWEDHMRKNHNR